MKASPLLIWSVGAAALAFAAPAASGASQPRLLVTNAVFLTMAEGQRDPLSVT